MANPRTAGRRLYRYHHSSGKRRSRLLSGRKTAMLQDVVPMSLLIAEASEDRVGVFMQAKQQVSIGIIGYGGRIRSLLDELLGRDPHLKIAAVADPDAGAIAKARAAHGSELKVHGDYQSLLADRTIDWVLVGSWNCLHVTHAVAALEAGKHLFCEKPLATTLEDCLAIRDAAARSGSHFAFGLTLRYSPHYQRVHQLIADGHIGRLVSFEFNETLAFAHGGFIFGNWRRRTEIAGSMMLEKCCHNLDLANWMCGSLPVRVASFGGRTVFTPASRSLADRVGTTPEGRPAYQSWDDPLGIDPFSDGAEVNDHQAVILQYANGVCATFHLNAHAAQLERRFYLLGTHGCIRADVLSGLIECTPLTQSATAERLDIDPSLRVGCHWGADRVLMHHLADTMLHERPPLAGIRQGLESAIVAFGIDQAQASGQVFDLQPLWRQADINPAALEPVGSLASEA